MTLNLTVIYFNDFFQVDNLSPTILKRMIFEESFTCQPTCGSDSNRNSPPVPDTLDSNGNPAAAEDVQYDSNVASPVNAKVPNLILQKEKYWKNVEQEKDKAEYSPRKIEEDFELSQGFDTLDVVENKQDSSLIIESAMQAEIAKMTEQAKPKKEEKKSQNTEIKDDLMIENEKNTAASARFDHTDYSVLKIDVEEIENFKEFSQLSPKETPIEENSQGPPQMSPKQSPREDHTVKDNCNHCCYENNVQDEKNVCFSTEEKKMQYIIEQDIEQRKMDHDKRLKELADKEEFNMRQKLNMDMHGSGGARGSWSGQLHRSRRFIRSSAVNNEINMDEMYRLPTEHLNNDRNATNEQLKMQRLAVIGRRMVVPPTKIHQEINEKLKLEEIELFEDQACGGFDSIGNIYHLYDDHITTRDLSRRRPDLPPLLISPPDSSARFQTSAAEGSSAITHAFPPQQTLQDQAKDLSKKPWAPEPEPNVSGAKPKKQKQKAL